MISAGVQEPIVGGSNTLLGCRDAKVCFVVGVAFLGAGQTKLEYQNNIDVLASESSIVVDGESHTGTGR